MPLTKAFKKLQRNVRKQYAGKLVPSRFRRRYGKRYDIQETKSISYAIANKQGLRTHLGRPSSYSRRKFKNLNG